MSAIWFGDHVSDDISVLNSKHIYIANKQDKSIFLHLIRCQPCGFVRRV